MALVPATNNVNLCLRVSTDGGSTYDATSGHYDWATGRWIYTAGFSAAGGTDTLLVVASGSTELSNNATYGGVSGSVKLFNPLGGAAYPRFSGQFANEMSSYTSSMGTVFAGSYMETTPVNAFRVLFNSGNIASGTVRVYGLAK